MEKFQKVLVAPNIKYIKEYVSKYKFRQTKYVWVMYFEKYLDFLKFLLHQLLGILSLFWV